MKKLFHPWGSLLFVTLPQVLLAAALFYAYRKAELVPSLPLIVIFSIQALFNVFVVVCAALGKKFPNAGKPMRITQLVGFIAIVSAATPFLLDQFNFASSLSPEAVYGTLCLAPLIYIATAILHHNEIQLMKIKTRILVCICVPLFFAVSPFLFMSMSSLFSDVIDQTGEIDWMHSAASLVLIALFALFFVFVCLVTSIVYHYRTKQLAPERVPEGDGENAGKQENEAPQKPAVKPYSRGYYIVIFILALALPLICLFLNNEAFFHILGDFSGAWFYILALVNGIAMLIPRKNKWLTLITLFFRSAGFLYVCYFAVTMVRFAPLSVAFYVFFLPLLALTPIVLFVVELFQIIDDFKFLRQHVSGLKISAVFVCGMLVLCAGVVGNGYAQKVNFDNAMCYVNGSEQELPPVKIPMLKSAMRYMRRSDQVWMRIGNTDNRTIGSLEGAPILSEFYHRVFFGEKTMDDKLFTHLNRIFLPEDAWGRNQQPNTEFLTSETENVKLADIKTETRFDEANGVYKTWVHLTLKNETDWADREYVTKFTLPDGVFVSDYYLDVLGERKFGLVAEKGAAKSVYDSIISIRQDPGIICYAQGNTVELRVFPFGVHESRTTGFELTFVQSDAFSIGTHTVALEGKDLTTPVVAGGTCFMPASYKANLEESTERTPKYYFVADAGRQIQFSNDGPRLLKERLAWIKDYAQKHEIAEADVHLTSCNVQKTDLAHLDEAADGEGGFNMALAMEKIYQDAKKQPEHYPVIIIAANSLYHAAIADNRRFAREFPEVECFYLLGSDGGLTPHNFVDNLKAETADTSPQIKRLFYNGFYFKNDGQNEVAYHSKTSFSDIAYGGSAYTDALLLSEKIEKADTNEQVIETVKDSIEMRLLTKNNSLIVLETKEQEDELNRRNKEFLEGKTLSTSAASMSEPGILLALLCAVLLLVVLWVKRKKRLAAAGL